MVEEGGLAMLDHSRIPEKHGSSSGLGNGVAPAMPWDIRPDKYLDDRQVRRLLAKIRERAFASPISRVAQTDGLLVHLLLASGLRVKEVTDLTVGDLFLDGERSAIYVRLGKRKGLRKATPSAPQTPPNPRYVEIDPDLKTHLQAFLAWKRERGEPTDNGAPLLRSPQTGTAVTVSTLQKAFKRCLKVAGFPTTYSIHCTRHTYARMLYAAAGYDLLYVQSQLGHTQITTTEVYARAFNPRKHEIARRLATVLAAAPMTPAFAPPHNTQESTRSTPSIPRSPPSSVSSRSGR